MSNALPTITVDTEVERVTRRIALTPRARAPRMDSGAAYGGDVKSDNSKGSAKTLERERSGHITSAAAGGSHFNTILADVGGVPFHQVALSAAHLTTLAQSGHREADTEMLFHSLFMPLVFTAAEKEVKQHVRSAFEKGDVNLNDTLDLNSVVRKCIKRVQNTLREIALTSERRTLKVLQGLGEVPYATITTPRQVMTWLTSNYTLPYQIPKMSTCSVQR